MYKHCPIPAQLLERGTKIVEKLRASIPMEGNTDRIANLQERPASVGDMTVMLNEKKGQVDALCMEPSLAESLHGYYDRAIASLSDEDSIERANDLRARAQSGDVEAQTLLEAHIKELTVMLLIPTAKWLPFLETVTLGDGDIPMVTTNMEQEAGVRVIGNDGGLREFGAVQNLDHFVVTLFRITTDWFTYKLDDLYHGGKVKNTALATINMARDMGIHIDSLIKSYLIPSTSNSIITGTFVTTGKASARHYLVHSSVATDNLPTGNYVELTDNTATSKLRKAVLKTAIQYCTSWGSGSFENGPDMVPVSIRVPSSHAAQFLDEAEVSTTPDQKREAFAGNPFQFSYGGYNFTIVPDSTLSPSLEVCIVQMNRPVGTFYTKPSVGRQITDEGPGQQALNRGKKMESKAVGFLFPTSWTVNVLCIRYREA